ncbi:phosphotransferase family protein [Micromonospora sp. WMMA1923]|uniref:phosphotransferase family protein n=1 Tax=Micromonospora sp. WMMA1923 TaxID=3404125 RepID=UPI003B9519C0
MRELIAVVGRLLGGGGTRVLTPLGAGTDHLAYDVDGEFVLRVRRDRQAADGPAGDGPAVNGPAAIRREIRVLDAVARVSPIPVPEVVAAAPDDGLLVVRRLAGTSLLDQPCPTPGRLVGQLADFLHAVHSLDAGLGEPDEQPLAAYLAEAVAALPRITPVLSADQHRLVVDFLSRTPPPEPPATVFCHADLGAEHLLAGADRTRLTGVLDWSDAARTDPARDLGRLYRDLGPSPAARTGARLTGTGAGDLVARAAFHARCALIEDLDFGLTEGDHRYVAAALARLHRTFTGAPPEHG